MRLVLLNKIMGLKYIYETQSSLKAKFGLNDLQFIPSRIEMPIVIIGKHFLHPVTTVFPVNQCFQNSLVVSFESFNYFGFVFVLSFGLFDDFVL
jgi:hypothetical protein